MEVLTTIVIQKWSKVKLTIRKEMLNNLKMVVVDSTKLPKFKF